MSGKFSRDKGKRAEHEFSNLFEEMTGIKLHRNLSQTRDAGHDLDGIDWMALEIKNQKVLKTGEWWRQTIAQASGSEKVPVLAYKIPYSGWRIIVPLMLIMEGPHYYLKQIENDNAWVSEIKYSAELTMDSFCLLIREEHIVDVMNKMNING